MVRRKPCAAATRTRSPKPWKSYSRPTPRRGRACTRPHAAPQPTAAVNPGREPVRPASPRPARSRTTWSRPTTRSWTTTRTRRPNLTQYGASDVGAYERLAEIHRVVGNRIRVRAGVRLGAGPAPQGARGRAEHDFGPDGGAAGGPAGGATR